jgi:hypothetical protein
MKTLKFSLHKGPNLALIVFNIILLYNSSVGSCLAEFPVPTLSKTERSDTITNDQTLYNGRIWQNNNYLISGDQFLFTKSFLPGDVTIRSKTFRDVSLKYDIYNDELLIPVVSGGIMQLNKEMVDSFSIVYSGKKYRFVNFPVDTTSDINGYFNILYHGDSFLLIKYIKKIEKLADGKNDSFYSLNKIYIKKDNCFHLIRGRKDAISLTRDKKAAKSYIKSHNLELTNDEPESYIPLVGYIDSFEHNK